MLTGIQGLHAIFARRSMGAVLRRVRACFKIQRDWLLCLLLGVGLDVFAQLPVGQVTVDFANSLGPLALHHMALGQGGLSEEPMWDNRIAEIRALKPAIIRLFVQEFFNLLPERGRYHFATLDRCVDTILATGAKPLLCLCFKPRALFPEINQDVVEPNDYREWEKLIFAVARHYKDRGGRGWYWEISNAPDIGEDGGCPYRFKPESYVRYYRHTVAAILRADPEARVGGPALAGVRSKILPALLSFCDTNGVPLHFIAWHSYTSDPKGIRATIDYAKQLLGKYPKLRPETFLDEWNMDLTNPPLDPRFQPCFLAETIWQMLEAGLDYSCYYHIRDWHADYTKFAQFTSPGGAAMIARWWNRMPQFDGLFDYQNTPRPSYFVFKLLSRLDGQRLPLICNQPTVHGFAAHDESLRMFNVMLWNFSPKAAQMQIAFANLPRDLRLRHLTLDAESASNEENIRLRPEPPTRAAKGDHQLRAEFEPYGVQFWMLE